MHKEFRRTLRARKLTNNVPPRMRAGEKRGGIGPLKEPNVYTLYSDVYIRRSAWKTRAWKGVIQGSSHTRRRSARTLLHSPSAVNRRAASFCTSRGRSPRHVRVCVRGQEWRDGRKDFQREGGREKEIGRALPAFFSRGVCWTEGELYVELSSVLWNLWFVFFFFMPLFRSD